MTAAVSTFISTTLDRRQLELGVSSQIVEGIRGDWQLGQLWDQAGLTGDTYRCSVLNPERSADLYESTFFCTHSIPI